MKYALIGCGRIATNHIKAVLNNGLEFAAVCDVDPQQMENLLAKHKLEKDNSIARYTDYRKMVEEVRPELVGDRHRERRTRADRFVLYRPWSELHY